MKRLSILLLALLLLIPGAQAATSYTANVCMPQPTQGDPSSQNTWGNLLNSGFSIIDGATQAASSISVAGGTDVILTFSCGTLDQTDAAHFTFTGLLTGNITVFWPNARNRMFSVKNSTTGAFSLTLAVNNGSGSPAGTTQVIAQGTTQIYIDDGTNILPRSTVGGISSVTLQTFTGSGTYTPTSGMKFAVVQEVGGGAGGYQQAAGNYGGGGGGAGECAGGVFTAAQIGASQTVTIGAGGSVSTGGGTTSLGALLTAVGGSTGAANDPIGGTGGTGGTGTGWHSAGGDGTLAPLLTTAPQLGGGNGGASCFGGGGRGGTGGLVGGNPGVAFGSGGGGNAFFGGFGTAAAGAHGFLEVYEYQ